MKKRFVSKSSKKRVKFKIVIFFIIFIASIIISFYLLSKSKIKIDDKKFINILIANWNKDSSIKDSIFVQKVASVFSNITDSPNLLLESSYEELTNYKSNTKKIIKQEEYSPLIYIYNSHQTEEYKATTFAEFSINPTVMMADYILQDVFNKNNYPTIVEERSIKNILNQNNWKYVYSYKASRLLLEDSKFSYPSLAYFIDVHRDSLPKDKTTVEVNGKNYARTIFLIGLENQNYQENLDFTTLLNNKMNEKYPGVSKGIYQKGGAGVNGIYNQDFSNRVILIEIGGYENTTSEVLNSSLAFSDCFMEVIKEL